MNEYVLMAMFATTGTWLVTALGAATVAFFKSPDKRIMNTMLGFASGVMIAASFWSLLQPAIEMTEEMSSLPSWLVATIGFLAGALFMWISEKTVNYTLKGTDSTDAHNEKISRIFMLVLSVTLHNIPEGLAVGVAFGALSNGGFDAEQLMGAVTVAIGIGLQNFPEGAAVSLPLRREGFSRTKSFILGQASGMVEPIAGIIGAMMVVYIQAILPFALSFAAGTMILVVVHELIPECRSDENCNPYFSTMGVIFGFCAMMMLDVMLG